VKEIRAALQARLDELDAWTAVAEAVSGGPQPEPAGQVGGPAKPRSTWCAGTAVSPTACRGAGTDDWYQCVHGCDPARMCATLVVVPPEHDARRRTGRHQEAEMSSTAPTSPTPREPAPFAVEIRRAFEPLRPAG
jgi:hypothetical protein